MPEASSMTSSNSSKVSGEGCSRATSIVPCRQQKWAAAGQAVR